MTPIQQMLLGVGGVTKPYIDDVFSTYLYTGNATARSFVNNTNLSKGGMVWIKERSNTSSSGYNVVTDSETGLTKQLFTDQGNSGSTSSTRVTALNNDGFSIGSSSYVNTNNSTYSSWSFAKQKGFFDVVAYTGNGSNGRQISHNLGCVPGCIMVKRTDGGSEDWMVYHRGNADASNAGNYWLTLNSTAAKGDSDRFYNLEPTATYFTVSDHETVNTNNYEYVAYVFAGGESTAATAHSVEFDGADDYLTVPSSSDFNFGTGDFTIECWGYRDQGAFWSPFDHLMGSDNFILFSYANSDIRVYAGGHLTTGVDPGDEKWFHLACVRESGKLKFYINGVKAGADHNFTLDITQAGVQIGRSGSGSYSNGKVSNLRIVKGTAVYTADFVPPTQPLTNISGTVLLCCNGTSATSATVTPGTITAGSSPVGGKESPFDDPAGFVFGDNENEGVVKCGTYKGNGAGDGPEIYLGFEPQWILHKSASVSGTAWHVFDCMRGIVSDNNDAILVPNTAAAEASDSIIDITPTGFKITTSAGGLNQNNGKYIYMAIRRPDPLVQKPVKVGTKVFAMDAGSTSSTIPTYDSGFPVDFSFTRDITSTADTYLSTRLTQARYIHTNITNAEVNGTDFMFDSNVGYGKNHNTTFQAFMWKRYAGFDVVTWEGSSANRSIRHNLSKTPEMVWIKNRDTTNHWIVGHKGLNGGTNPWTRYLRLNTTDSELDYEMFQDLAPTATHLHVLNNDHINQANQFSLAMLFASVDGVSKVGSYTGSANAQTITTGFQPRFVLIKNASVNSQYTNWYVLDTTRGWGSGNDKYLELNDTSAQADFDFGYPTSNGFYLTGGSESYNQASNTFIYYAHA